MDRREPDRHLGGTSNHEAQPGPLGERLPQPDHGWHPAGGEAAQGDLNPDQRGASEVWPMAPFTAVTSGPGPPPK